MNYYSAIFINMTQLNKIIKLVLAEQSSSKIKGTASKIVGTIMKAMGGAATDEQLILDALNMITSKEIYNEVLSIVKRQKQTEFERADALQFLNWERLGTGRGWRSVMEWIQITDFQPLLYGDSAWLSKYANILKKFNTNESVGSRPTTGPAPGSTLSIAGDHIGDDTTAWDDPEFQHMVLTTLQITLSFVPIVGWAVAAGIGLGNAKMYYDEGNTKMAGLEAIFAIIPGLALASKLGLKKVAPTVMSNLAKKVALKQTKNLTKQEIYILSQLGKNQKALKTELDNYFKTGIMKSAKQLTKDKLTTTMKKLAVTGTKATAGLGSYYAIARLYNSVYDASQEQITQAELNRLNDQVDAELLKWIASKEKSPKLESKQRRGNVLNEIAGLTWGDLFGIGAGLAVIGAAIKYGPALAKKAGMAVWKSNAKQRLFGIRKFYRDLRLYKELGMDAKHVRSLYKSGAPLADAKLAWNEIERQIQTGELTDINAIMKQLPYLTRGSSKEIYDIIRTKLNNKLISATGRRKTIGGEIDRLKQELKKQLELGTHESLAKAEWLQKEITALQSKMSSSSLLTTRDVQKLDNAGWKTWTKQMEKSGMSYNEMNAYLRKQRNKNWINFAAVVASLGTMGFVALAREYDKYRQAENEKLKKAAKKTQSKEIEKELEKQQKKQQPAVDAKRKRVIPIGGTTKVDRIQTEPGGTATPNKSVATDTTMNSFD